MTNPLMQSVEQEQLRSGVPALRIGDTVKVHQRIVEGNRERIQVFQGVIMRMQGGGVNATFTVRRIASHLSLIHISEPTRPY